MQNQEILTLLLEKDDLSWKTILYDLVTGEQMNPWDVDISRLTQKYIEAIKAMQAMDFRISGKILLAAAILLKIKSQYLLQHDIDELDRLIARTTEPDMYPEFFSEFSQDLFKVAEKIDNLKPHLIPRTPQPRARKITIYDLAEALQQALEVKKRKLYRNHPTIKFEMPTKKFDIGNVIRLVYSKIKAYFFQNNNAKLTFSTLVTPTATKEEKVYTFIPLLHLDHQRKINISQEQNFGEIGIELLKAKKEVGNSETKPAAV